MKWIAPSQLLWCLGMGLLLFTQRWVAVSNSCNGNPERVLMQACDKPYICCIVFDTCTAHCICMNAVISAFA